MKFTFLSCIFGKIYLEYVFHIRFKLNFLSSITSLQKIIRYETFISFRYYIFMSILHYFFSNSYKLVCWAKSLGFSYLMSSNSRAGARLWLVNIFEFEFRWEYLSQDRREVLFLLIILTWFSFWYILILYDMYEENRLET